MRYEYKKASSKLYCSYISVQCTFFYFCFFRIQHAHWFNEKSFSGLFGEKVPLNKISFVMNQNYADGLNGFRAENTLNFIQLKQGERIKLLFSFVLFDTQKIVCFHFHQFFKAHIRAVKTCNFVRWIVFKCGSNKNIPDLTTSYS